MKLKTSINTFNVLKYRKQSESDNDNYKYNLKTL